MIDRARSHLIALGVALAVAGWLAGCASPPPRVAVRAPIPAVNQGPPPPVALPGREPEPAPATYVVKRGDTLYQIALDHGLDYRELAAWNGIENVNVIHIGQVLLVGPPVGGGATTTAPLVTAPPAGGGAATTAPLVTGPPVTPSGTEVRAPTAPPPPTASAGGHPNTPIFKTEPKAIKLPYSEQVLAQLQHQPSAVPEEVRATPAPPVAAPAPGATAPAPPLRADSGRVPEIDDDSLGWIWPAQGKIVAGFSESANLKGIDIAGRSGEPVVASAAGKVVYAGTGLRGYGKLIIVKHNNTFLSAYAHNKEIDVKEGQQVAKGQKIAEMGDTDADQVMLHFEIRRLGKPVDPTKLLPPT
jgi:lipoprotein NlpD